MMCGAVAFFAALDAIAKYLGRHMDPLQVDGHALHQRHSCIALIIFNPLTRPELLKTRRPGLQFVRGLFFVLDHDLQLPRVPLSAARRGAGDHVRDAVPGRDRGRAGAGRMGRLAALDRDRRSGFIGVLVVIRPGLGGGMQWAALLSVAAAIFYAAYGITTRMVSRHRFQRNHAVLRQPGGHGRHGAGPAVRMDHAVRDRPGHAGGGRRARLGRPFPADRRPPAGAGLGAFAVHLHPADLGHDARAFWCSTTCRPNGR